MVLGLVLVLVLLLVHVAEEGISRRRRLNDQLVLQTLNVFLLRCVEVHGRFLVLVGEEFGALVQVEGGFDGEGAIGVVVGEQTGGDCAFEAKLKYGKKSVWSGWLL